MPPSLNESQLQQVLQVVSDAELLASELVGGFSFSELNQLIAVANDLPLLKSLAGVVVPAWESLSQADQASLVAYVQANCKFPANVVVEAWISKVLQAAILLSSIYQVVDA